MATSERIDEATPNGGVYAIAYFLSAQGEPVEKSAASRVEIVEYDPAGEAIHRTYMAKGYSASEKHLPGKHSQSSHNPHKGGSSRVWTGQQHEESPTLNKLQTGAIGEQLAMRALAELTGQEFSTLNVGVNNAPIDVAGDHLAVEVKAGVASLAKASQTWRANIGQVGKEEKALIAEMSPEQKRAHYDYKRQQILERKQQMLDQMSQEAGAPIKPVMVGVILSPDGSRGDVYMVPGFHLRLAWSQYATDEYYLGTYDAE